MTIRKIQKLPLPLAKPSNEWEKEQEKNLSKLSEQFVDYSDRNQQSNPVSKTASFTVGKNNVYFCDATAGDITVTLLPAALAEGIIYYFKKTDSSVNTVDLTPNGSETIEGGASHSLTGQNDVVAITSNGSNYFILNTYS